MSAHTHLRHAGGLLPAVVGSLLLIAGAAAQDEGLATDLAPIEDLQGHFHMTPAEVVSILSSRSLMLTDNQSRLIEEAMRIARENEQEREAFVGLTENATMIEAPPLQDMELDAILYFSRENWTFWLNGQAVTPKSLPQGVTVRRVDPSMVELAWTPDAKRPDDVRQFSLEPGQVYLVDEGRVMESAERVAAPPEEAIETEPLEPPGEDDEGAAGVPDAAPEDLALSAEQAAQIQQLQDALAIVSGNAEALGMTEQQLQDLQAGLAAGGGSLTAEQQQQLQAIEDATGAGQ